MENDARARTRTRLKRIAGQVAGLQKMLDEDRYCLDILTQIAAVRSALDAAGVAILTDHVQHCLMDQKHRHADADGKSSQELATEVNTILQRFLK